MKIWRCFFLIGLLITLLGLTFNLSQQKDYQYVAVEKKSTSNIVTDVQSARRAVTGEKYPLVPIHYILYVRFVSYEKREAFMWTLPS